MTTGEIIATIIGSSALFSFIQFLITRHDGKKNESYVLKSDIKPIKDGLMALTQDRLEHLLTKYIEAGEVTTNQAKVIDNLIGGYTALGGNDFVEHLYNQFKELPIR